MTRAFEGVLRAERRAADGERALTMAAETATRERRVVALRRRLVPYFLLGPGILWLILFFVVPMYFMGRLSLESGIFPRSSSTGTSPTTATR